MFNKKFPYTTMSEYNLDWIIEKIKKLEHSIDDFEAFNKITFGGDWDISKQYKVWTIVTDPITHDGYLSIKPVPENVSLNDEDYWLKISDYTSGLAEVNARIDEVENVIADSINRRILIFGDSYFLNNPIGGGQSVLAFLNEYKKNNPFTFDVKSDGQEGFSIASPNSFEYDVVNYTSIFNADEVTDVVFAGGYNDRVNDKSDIELGMSATLYTTRTKYPNAKIHVGHFGWNSATSGANRQRITYHSIPAYASASKYGAGFMCNSEYTMHNYEFFTSDNIHPTEDGRKEIAKQIINYFITGTCDVHYQPKAVTYNGSGIPGPTGPYTDDQYTVTSKLDNDQVTIYLPNGRIVYTISPFTITTDPVALLELNNPSNIGYRLHFMGNWDMTRNYTLFPLTGNFRTTDGFKDYSNCMFFINEGKLYCTCHKLNSSETAYGPVTNITELNVQGQAITIPTLQC